MAGVMVREQVGMKKTGVSVTVANNPKAKLMYYLHTVACVLDLDDPRINRLKDYSRYNSLSDEDTHALLLLVLLVSPDELIGKVFFPSDELCGDSSNEFYEISKVSHIFAMSGSVMIGGEQKRVNKVMTFKMAWIKTNFFDPVQELNAMIQRAKREEARRKQDTCVIL